jgi:hypothetical protein
MKWSNQGKIRNTPNDVRITVRITGFGDFVHHREFRITGKHNISETGSVFVFR